MIDRPMIRCLTLVSVALLSTMTVLAQVTLPVPDSLRGKIDAERSGMHDAANIRTVFYNYGMVGDYPQDPGTVDLSVFHSVEVPKGGGLNYSDGITPFVLARIRQRNGVAATIMETGYRENQQFSPFHKKIMRFEPRPGYFQPSPSINKARSVAMSNDPRTWPDQWIDKLHSTSDPGWSDAWNGYFGKQPAADLESFFVVDDNLYDAWDYYPDSRDATRRGLGLRVEVRGFQWGNPQAANVIFWHYDITNESTTDYSDNIIFGLYMDSGVGGSALSCDGVYESDDDNAYFDKSLGLNLVYTWDRNGKGIAFNSNCASTGYLGYAYLETPGNSTNSIDDDDDGITNEQRDGGSGQLLVGQSAIMAYAVAHYDTAKFQAAFGGITQRPAYKAGRWWTGDEDMDWVAELNDTGEDGQFSRDNPDVGEKDGIPTAGETNFDQTDLHESDQIGLTGFKMNRISAGQGSPSTGTDYIVFFDDGRAWPKRLYDQWTDPIVGNRFDTNPVSNYNIGFFFASGPFKLLKEKRERFSLALGYGADLDELKRTVKVVQQIYNANYRFAVPPELPSLRAEAGDKYVRLTWDEVSELSVDPVTGLNDFEGYRIYRSTDPTFLDPKLISNALGTGPLQGSNGKPLVAFDLKNGVKGFSSMAVEGVQYYLGDETGLTHTWADTSVDNGQLYYYAVTSYDRGADTLDFHFYPSENPITVTQSVRGGIILPRNVAQVRPNPKTLGYRPAEASGLVRRTGRGTGTLDLKILNSKDVPANHVLLLKFHTDDSTKVRADYYELIDSSNGKRLISKGTDLLGSGTGQIGGGLLPIVYTPETTWVDHGASAFRAGGKTNVKLSASYQYVEPNNRFRTGYPVNFTILFDNSYIDTSLNGIGAKLRSRPVKYRVVGHEASGDIQLKTFLYDDDNDSTLSSPGEYMDAVSYMPGSRAARVTWRVRLDTTGQYLRGPIVLPRGGDIYDAIVRVPYGEGDVFAFTTVPEHLDNTLAKQQFSNDPYVVPNPYVGFASFEPERFAVTGRGIRRMEFRGLPANCTVRIFAVNGDLIQTLRHDGSTDGMVPWDLRTKDNLEIAPGLYIFHVESDLGTKMGKFAVIK
ncbi:MAG: hypothetical protein Q8P51_19995 [Ignavibacteria bacterium]|nr:hypothetical protein [Ignavibacteria bacterium]